MESEDIIGQKYLKLNGKNIPFEKGRYYMIHYYIQGITYGLELHKIILVATGKTTGRVLVDSYEWDDWTGKEQDFSDWNLEKPESIVEIEYNEAMFEAI